MSNGMQVAVGQVTEYYQEVKMPIIAGYDVARLYFSTAEMDCQVGCQRMERVLTHNPKVMSKSEIDYVELVSKLNTEIFDWNLREHFRQLRFDKNHHLGLGDIRLTIAQQEEICDLVERLYHLR